MLNKKIYAAEGDWLDSQYEINVKPLFEQNDVSVVVYKKIPLIKMYDENFWNSDQSTCDVAFVDDRLWEQGDDYFQYYIQRLAKIKCQAIVVFDYIYQEKLPYDVVFYQKKLIQRTQLAAKIIKENNRQAVLISPCVNLFSNTYWHQHIDYFRQMRNCFDVYGYSMCHDFSEQALAKSQSALKQVFDMLNKDVWINKWSIPCSGESEINYLKRQKNNYLPYDLETARKKMTHLFTQTESMCNNKTKWFFTGTGKDEFHKDRKIQNIDYCNAREKISLAYSDRCEWNHSHFIGSMNYAGELKQHIVEHLLHISKTCNV